MYQLYIIFIILLIVFILIKKYILSFICILCIIILYLYKKCKLKKYETYVNYNYILKELEFPVINEYIEPLVHQTEELVVAICTEDVDWIDMYAKDYAVVTVYNKCGFDVKFTSKNIKVINTKNIGSCDYAFLSYVIDRYDTLPDYIEFCKGSNPPMKLYPNCLACIDVNLKDSKHYKNILMYHNKSGHGFNYNKNMNNSKWENSEFNTLGDWIETIPNLTHNIYRQHFCNIIYGGRFGATKKQLLKTKKETYQAIINYQKYQKEEIDHFIERTWRPLLCRPKYFLVVLAIFKNEKIAMKEWLQHYMRQGVDHFYLVNNNSTDNWIPETLNASVTIFTDNESHKQVDHYNNYYLEMIKKDAEWVIVCDLDEFIYAKPSTTISSILKLYDDKVGIVKLRWKMFGSNNHITQPKSIIDGFTKRKIFDDSPVHHENGSFNNMKTIIKTSFLIKFDVHVSQHHECEIIDEVPSYNEYYLTESKLQLNHYAIQSYDWFKKIKCTRGSATTIKFDHIRNDEYFKKYDVNEIDDSELSTITKNTFFDYKKKTTIPILINFYNFTVDHYHLLKKVLALLDHKNFTNIIVLDNFTNNKKMDMYYKSYEFISIARVIYLNKNYNKDALHHSGLLTGLDKDWHLYLQCDNSIEEELQKNPFLQ